MGGNTPDIGAEEGPGRNNDTVALETRSAGMSDGNIFHASSDIRPNTGGADIPPEAGRKGNPRRESRMGAEPRTRRRGVGRRNRSDFPPDVTNPGRNTP